jgi:hypothetical protein
MFDDDVETEEVGTQTDLQLNRLQLLMKYETDLPWLNSNLDVERLLTTPSGSWKPN